MKTYFKILLFVCIFSFGTLLVLAAWPAVPSGESAGGRFGQYLEFILGATEADDKIKIIKPVELNIADNQEVKLILGAGATLSADSNVAPITADCISNGEQDCKVAGTFKAGTHNVGTSGAGGISLAGAGELLVQAVAGFFDGTNDFSKITDLDFIADNIKKDVNLFGITGTLDTAINVLQFYGEIPPYCGDGILQATEEWEDALADGLCTRIPNITLEQITEAICTKDTETTCVKVSDGEVKVTLNNPDVASLEAVLLALANTTDLSIIENTCNSLTLNTSTLTCSLKYFFPNLNKSGAETVNSSVSLSYSSPVGKSLDILPITIAAQVTGFNFAIGISAFGDVF